MAKICRLLFSVTSYFAIWSTYLLRTDNFTIRNFKRLYAPVGVHKVREMKLLISHAQVCGKLPRI